MNGNCVTGILIDISNVDQETPPILQPRNLLLDYESPTYANKPTVSPTELPKATEMNLKGLSSNKSEACRQKTFQNDIYGELLENEIFDFEDTEEAHSPVGSLHSGKYVPLACSPCEPWYTTRYSSHEDVTLSTEELAEVFKEATVVAVKLENYVHQKNRTPEKSPDITALYLERSAQKKLRSSCLETPRSIGRSECKVAIDDDIRPVEQTECKKPLSFSDEKLAAKPSTTPGVKRSASSVSSRLAMPPIKKMFGTGSSFRSSSVGPSTRAGPLKATAEGVQPWKPVSRSVTGAVKSEKSLLPTSIAVASRSVAASGTLVKSSPATPKVPTRPVLIRRNSDVSSLAPPKFATTTSQPSCKSQSRRSFGGVDSCNSAPATPQRARRLSTQPVPVMKPSPATGFPKPKVVPVIKGITPKFKGMGRMSVMTSLQQLLELLAHQVMAR